MKDEKKRPSPKGPDRDADNDDFDARPPEPPVRRETPSGGHQQPLPPTRSSHSRSNNSTSSAKKSDPSTLVASKDEKKRASKTNSDSTGETSSKGSSLPQTGKQTKQGKKRRETKASARQKKSPSNKKETGPRKSNDTSRRSDNSIRKTRATVGGTNYGDTDSNAQRERAAYVDTENANDENSDNVSRTDETLSTVPDPPSLHICNHYALRPGAYRMSTGGVARYVNASNFSLEDGIADNIATPETAVPFDSKSTQEEESVSPPLFRPTTSTGEHGAGNSGKLNQASGIDDTMHVDSKSVKSKSGNTGTLSSIDETSSYSKTNNTDSCIRNFCSNKRNRSIAICSVLIFIIVIVSIVAISATTGFGGKNKGYSASITIVKRALPEYTLTAIDVEDSPQSKALDWMATYDDVESYTIDRMLQRFALMSLKYSLANGDPLRRSPEWFADTNECEWFNNTKCVNNIYKELHLSSKKNSIRGRIVPELALLSSLEILQTSQKDLVGFLPTELGQISTLKEIRMNGNQFRGSVPTHFGNLRNLEHVDFANNLLEGTIPTEIGLWTGLTALSLSKNDLTGAIPSDIGELNDLETISVSSNKLKGPLPSEMGLLTKIRSFDAGKNNLNGEFVAMLEGSGSALKQLDLQSNRFTGTLPSTIGQLTNLRRLYISDNKFTGSLPREVGKLTTLVRLELRSNKFNSKIPSELGMLSNAESMILSDNEFTGSVPSEICDLTSLKEGIAIDSAELSCTCSSCHSDSDSDRRKG